MPDSAFDRRRLPDGFAFRDWIAPDGWRHRAFAWAPAGAARGSLIFQTGRADHAEKYLESYAHFVARGWAVEGFDWRGQGGSRPPAPVAPDDRASFAPLAADLAAFVADWRRRTRGPHVVVAHSMGGLVTLAALAGGMRIDAAVLASPMLAVRTGRIPPPVARAIAGTMVRLGLGGRAAWRDRGIEPARQLRLTADRARYADSRWWKRAVPGLATGVPSWRWIAAALAVPRTLAALPLETIATPVLLLAAGADALVDPAANAAVARRLPHGRAITVAGARHELLREADAWRDPALAAIDAFLGEAAA